MTPLTTLYILGGAVALAALVFVVMIISEIVRRPQLPDVTSFEPPPTLQRVIRALTPLPVATQPPISTRPTPVPIARSTPAPIARTPAPVAARAPAPAPVAAAAPVAVRISAPVAVAAPVAIAAPAAVAASVAVAAAAPVAVAAPRTLPPRPPPSRTAAPAPSGSSASVASAASSVASPARVSAYPAFRIPPQFARVDRSIDIRRPLYPKRSHTLRRVILGLFATTLLASGAAVAYPSLLDPICDDYEWFGAEQAQVVRDYARDAHARIADVVDSL